jgi:RNA polymerase sigma factor (sigma-70 family)
MTEVSTETSSLSDSTLVAAVRAGSAGAYGTLYERHSGAARRLARQLTRCSAEADDFVSEAFAKVLETLRKGGGPNTAFRTYTLTVLRNVAYQRYRRDGRVTLQEDFQDVPGTDLRSDPSISVAESAERTLIAEAFTQLPERWRTVLWYADIEGMAHAEIAPLLGLSTNGVAALAYRAREGMRQAYLQVHIAGTAGKRCRATIDRLGVWTRKGLSRREAAQVEAHLDRCERCQALAADLVDLNGRMRAAVAPLVLGSAVAGYLASGGNTASTISARVAITLADGGSTVSLVQQVAGVAVSAATLAAAVMIGLIAETNGSRPPAVDVGRPAAVRESLPTGQSPSDRAVPVDLLPPTASTPVVAVEALAPAPSESRGSAAQRPQPVVEPSVDSPVLPAGHDVVSTVPNSSGAGSTVDGAVTVRATPLPGTATGVRVELGVPNVGSMTGPLLGESKALEQIDVTLGVHAVNAVPEHAVTINLSASGFAN